MGDARAIEPPIEALGHDESPSGFALVLARFGPRAREAVPVLIERFPVETGTSVVGIDGIY